MVQDSPLGSVPDIGKVDIHPKYMRRVHRADGYEYKVKGVVALPRPEL